MGKNSSIEWTDHTFNPWWGCVKVSPACAHCYAEAWAKRVGQNVWGPESTRRFFGEAHWKEPIRWNADASQEKRRRRVFCASMADVFEPRKELDAERTRLWNLIQATPWLDWLLLTKRPGSIGSLVPWTDVWPKNVWLGTTVEDQTWASKRLPNLLKHPAARRFLSCEPLLGAIDLSKWLGLNRETEFSIDWVIAGGESGSRSRPMLPGWARCLRDQCRRAAIPFHFKQWGHWAPASVPKAARNVEKFWDGVEREHILMEPRGKKEAGRFLDGVTWDQLPETA